MLRIIKKTRTSIQSDIPITVPDTRISNNHPTVYGWVINYYFPTHNYEFGTISCSKYHWSNLKLPKKTSLHTPKKLQLWFRKLLSKKYNINNCTFVYDSSMNSYDCSLCHETHSIQLKSSQLEDVIMFPLFNKNMTDIDDINVCKRIPNLLKIEIRSHLESYYHTQS